MIKTPNKGKNLKEILETIDMNLAQRKSINKPPVAKQKKESAQMLFEQFPIGKYKGQGIEIVLRDKGYCEWLCRVGWFENKYPPLFHVIEEHLKLYFPKPPSFEYPLSKFDCETAIQLKTKFFICPN